MFPFLYTTKAAGASPGQHRVTEVTINFAPLTPRTPRETLRFFRILKHIEAETNGFHFADDILKFIFMNESYCSSIQFLLKCVPNGWIGDKSALFQIMAWIRIDKHLPEPMMTWFTDENMRHSTPTG